MTDPSDCEPLPIETETKSRFGTTYKIVNPEGPAVLHLTLDRKKNIGRVMISAPIAVAEKVATGRKPPTYKAKQEGTLDRFMIPSEEERRLGGQGNTFAFPLQITDEGDRLRIHAEVHRKDGPEPKIKGSLHFTFDAEIRKKPKKEGLHTPRVP